MSILAVLIPIALFLGLCGLAAFFWAIGAGQYDDLEGAALRILIDDANDKPAVTAKTAVARTEPAAEAASRETTA